MDIKVSVNIIEGGNIEGINYTVKTERYDKKRGIKIKNNFNINFELSPTPQRVRVINLNQEAYKSFITDAPVGVSKIDWNRMSKIKRLETNLKVLAENFNGVLDNYQVFDD